MRVALLIWVLLLACIAGAQGSGSESLFTTMRPDLWIVVSKHSSGADQVEITTQQEGYPRELLSEQIKQLGVELGSEIRGLDIVSYNPIPDNPKTSSLKASFAVFGLIRREDNVLGLQALARAFAGAKEPHTVDGLMIQYSTETPTTAMVRSYKPNNGLVVVEAQANPAIGIEYRIKLNSQDRDKIEIPEGHKAQEAASAPPVQEPKTGPDWLVLSIIIVAGLALGALVYSLLLRPRPTSRPR